MVDAISIKSKIIKLIATDIDGVWTDAKLYCTADGNAMKAFSTYDCTAVAMLKKAGLEIALLTGENSQIVERLAEKLNIKYKYLYENQKLKRLQYLCKLLDITLDNIAFIGDDINDVEALENVGLSALSTNSPILESFNPDYVTRRKGGEGAFREFVDLILQNR